MLTPRRLDTFFPLLLSRKLFFENRHDQADRVFGRVPPRSSWKPPSLVRKATPLTPVQHPLSRIPGGRSRKQENSRPERAAAGPASLAPPPSLLQPRVSSPPFLFSPLCYFLHRRQGAPRRSRRQIRHSLMRFTLMRHPQNLFPSLSFPDSF